MRLRASGYTSFLHFWSDYRHFKRKSTIHPSYYRLDIQDISSGNKHSDFLLYQEGIKRQLEANEGFFRKRLIEILKDQGYQDRPFEKYLRIVVRLQRVVQDGVQGEVTGVYAELVPLVKASVYMDDSMVIPFKGWRDKWFARLEDWTGMLIVIKFMVHYPQDQVLFEMDMRLPFLDISTAMLKAPPNPEWRKEIEDALGDRPKTNPDLKPIFRLCGSFERDSLFLDKVGHLKDAEIQQALDSFEGLRKLRTKLWGILADRDHQRKLEANK